MLVKANTLTELWEGACRKMFFASTGSIEKFGSMTTSYINMLACNSMAYSMDVGKDLNLTKSRFPKLQRDYMDLDDYEKFLDRCDNVTKRRGSVTQMTSPVRGPTGINRTKPTGNKAHGNCIFGFTYRTGKRGQPPTLGMHSRVSYLSYLGALDIALAYCIAREIGERQGFAVEECAFTWYCDAYQFANMQSVAFVSVREDLMEAIDDDDEWPDKEYPTIGLMRRTIRSFDEKYERGFTPEEEKYAQLMRYRKRYERQVYDEDPGPLPSIPVETLTLEPLRNPTRRMLENKAIAEAAARKVIQLQQKSQYTEFDEEDDEYS